MNRKAAAYLLLALIGLAAIYLVVVSGRERAYRRHIDRGEQALARDDTFSAMEAFTAAIAVKGDSMVGYLKRGETYRRRDALETAPNGGAGTHAPAGRPYLEAALRDLRRASELDPMAPRPHELMGDVSYALGRHARAAERYQRYVELDDGSPRILYKLALSLYSAGQPAPALDALRRAVKLDDTLAEAYYLTGLCARDLQRPTEALAALERAVHLAPAMLQAREELGNLYGRLNRPNDRITQLEALRALDGTASRDVALGLAYARAGRSDSAVTTLSAAAERYPDHPYTYVALGRVWLELAQPRGDRVALSKALGALEGAVGTDNSSEALTLFGRALLLADDEELAERMLQQATEKLPVDATAFYYLAEAAERRSHIAVARAALIDYQTLEGDDGGAARRAWIATRIADHSARLGEPAVAVTWFQRAIAAGGEDASLLLRLADAQMRAGDLPAARITVTKVLESDPANRGAHALLRRLR